jgi:non-specific serine/threonine protein kinase
MIFSSEDQIEMESFITTLKLIINHENLDKKYIKIKEIYRGSQSHLYLGKNIETNEKVVIKQIDQNLLDKSSRYETVLWERDIIFFLKKISHPNIVKVHDYYRTEESFYFILEYIPNGNLKTFLFNNGKSLTPKQLKQIMLELSTAVLFLHSVGIIHRDLKPENVLISKKENGDITVKLIDFGFSRVLGKLDNLNESYGTFSYASPEILNKTPYNFKTDIWSLGVIFYLIIVGVHPFGENEKDLKEIHHNILNAKYKIPDKVDSKMKNLIQKCLNVEAKKRPKIEDVVKILL